LKHLVVLPSLYIETWRNVCGDAPSATWKKTGARLLIALGDAIDSVFRNTLHNLIR
jgi:hypothetical protein